ncbi:ATP-binding protein [Paenibacillus sp. J5C_2022]|uniref:ATP-binding protein n=1 Tax=Paenibacillus sp. J5C2022 TaxID=2977129 RepID=UPI0021D22EC6|nr:ATP-binding protein [Paenibacillus sp. J5C2022]MCU6709976.1 ATP-binding protein [Paenibacillus sp. J5C2022]
MMRKRKYAFIIVIILFLSMLTGGRLVWLELFKPGDQPFASQGKLDLRGWDASAGKTVTLDGEWRFYPGVLLMSDNRELEQPLDGSRMTTVPSGWNEGGDPPISAPYGFGSYRLTIVVDSANEAYSIYVPSVRSSSQLYVNGSLIAASGYPAPSAEEHTAENVPYIATFMTDAQGIIDVVIQAANYTDPRSGGLIRSLKFGTDEAVYAEKQRSMAAQQLIAAALVIQAVYMLVLFAIERNKSRFYFAVAMLSFTLILLNSSEDKLLLQWLPITHDWSFKLLCLSLTILYYAMLQTLSDQIPEAWRAGVLRFYSIAAVSGIAASILLTPQGGNVLQYVIFTISMPILVLLVVSVFRMAGRGKGSGLMQFLVFLAFANHMAWWLYFIVTGIKVLYYPFDLILGMILLSAIWIKRYFNMYAEQKALAAKLENVNRKKDEFLVNTSHELRNPLHGIINISQVVLEREREALSDLSVREMETALKVGKRMSYMLGDLLDVARLKENGLRLQVESVSLRLVVDGVMDMVRYMASGKTVKLSNRIPESFPPVLADENRLIQIMLNLLHNAIKFTPHGEISVEARIVKEQVHITVSDTGIGMDQETVRKVFEPYEQARSMSGYEGGFGLGLNICKQLVELHGGTIEVHSAPAQGSRFTFSLKLGERANGDVLEKERDEADRPAPMPFAAAAMGPTPLKERSAERQQKPMRLYGTERPRILAVDDDALNLGVITSILSKDDYEIVTVTNGEEALALLHEQKWELIITDVMMPGMSGYELTSRIRERYAVSELPVLILTARSRPEDIEVGFWVGANDYVTKPVEASELQARVQAWTNLNTSIRERIRMEAAWLQAQIEPHFFLNTLNSIAALHTVNPDLMQELIAYFGDFLREKFKFQNVGELIPMKDELTLVRSYLFIEKTRFDDRLQVDWEIDDGIEALRLPPYAIQPLVENAIHHGLMERREGGKLRIKLTKRGDGAEITVSDNGVGMSKEVLAGLLKPASEDGVALRNVDLRLKRLYGSGLSITSAPGEGTTVSFIIQ